MVEEDPFAGIKIQSPERRFHGLSGGGGEHEFSFEQPMQEEEVKTEEIEQPSALEFGPTDAQREILEHYDLEDIKDLDDVLSLSNLNLSDKKLQTKEEYKNVVNTKERAQRVEQVREALYPSPTMAGTDANKRQFIKAVQGYIGLDKSGKLITETGRPLPPAVLTANQDKIDELKDLLNQIQQQSQKKVAGKKRVDELRSKALGIVEDLRTESAKYIIEMQDDYRRR